MDWDKNRTLKEWSRDIKVWREVKGFETSWENIMEKLMLVVTEVSEAAEAYRTSDYKGFNEEMADIMIRLFDISGSCGIDIEREIQKKMTINEQRPIKHGKVC